MDGDAAQRRKRAADLELMLHFAYGSNMHRAHDAQTCAGARAARRGAARRIIASSSPRTATPRSNRRGAKRVYGVLWRLTPRDRVTLDLWENIAGGLYRAATLRGSHGGQPAAGA